MKKLKKSKPLRKSQEKIINILILINKILNFYDINILKVRNSLNSYHNPINFILRIVDDEYKIQLFLKIK